MNESDLDNAIAQAEQFLVLAKDLKAAFTKQVMAANKAEAEAIAQKLSEKDVQSRIWNAQYANTPDRTRLMGAVKHACVTLSFSLAKLRK